MPTYVEPTHDIELGTDVYDCVTGFKGVAVARLDRLFGGNELQIQPRECTDDGKPKDAVWFEEGRVRLAGS